MNVNHHDSRPMTEEEEDRLPVLLPVLPDIDDTGKTLFIGNAVAANDADLLLRNGITSTMNLAVNVEMPPLSLSDGTVIRRTHIGLIDGPGNIAQHLLGAVLVLHGIINQQSPGKAHYPPHRAGNVLAHCRGGRSRSAGTIALYLHLFRAERFPAFEDALLHVRMCRGLDETQPQAAMLDLCQQALVMNKSVNKATGI
ncbi:dual specificity protein phosphatase family protein [Mesorhizobium sp. NPDC059054]|uniref:dual specificity protein phosphatase family protein n=1 Tax=Mesorhizobium sp. NPDC059054 TaxID=3346711 RepID=UPI0036CDE1A9